MPHSKSCATATDGADDGELFLERRRSESLVFDDNRLKTASYDASEGFGLRAVKGETTGYAHSTELTEAALKRAAETARLAVGAGGATLAPAPQATNQRLYTDADPMADAEFNVKVETLREIDAFTRAPRPPRRPSLRFHLGQPCKKSKSYGPKAPACVISAP